MASKKSASFTKRSAARLAAVQAIYQLEQTQGVASQIIQEFLTYRLGQTIDEDQYIAADPAYFTQLVEGTAGLQEELDERITLSLREGWSFERLESILRAILRVGACELKLMPYIPTPVILNEYIDLTHAFFSAKEPAFVNGTLERLAKELRPSAQKQI